MNRRSFSLISALAALLTILSTSAIAAPPTIAGASANRPVDDDATVTPFTNSNVTLNDPDSDPISVTVTVSPSASGTLSTGAGAFSSSGGGVYTYTEPAGTTDASTRLRALVFTPNNLGTPETMDTVNFEISVTAAGDTVTSTGEGIARQVTITYINDAPDLTRQRASVAIEDDQTSQPFASSPGNLGYLVDDPDTGALITLTVTLSTTGGLDPGILAGTGFVATGDIYTTTGSPDTVETRLQGLTFTPDPNQVPVGDTVTTTFTITADDGFVTTPVIGDSVTAVVTSKNDAPVINWATETIGLNANQTVNPFADAVVEELDVAVAAGGGDGADAASEELTATISTTFGTFSSPQFSPASGTELVFTGDADDVQSALRAVNFTAPGDEHATPFALTVTLADTLASPVFTEKSVTVTVPTPTLQGARASQPVVDDALINPFSIVTFFDFGTESRVIEILLRFDSDGDGGVDGDDVDDGTRGQFANLGGFTRNETGGEVSYTFTGSAFDSTNAIRQLVFRPEPNFVVGSETVGMAINLRLPGSNALLGSDANTSVVISPANDRPQVLGTAGQELINDDETARPFAGVRIVDVDEGGEQVVTVTVSLDDAAKGEVRLPFGVIAAYAQSSGETRVTAIDHGLDNGMELMISISGSGEATYNGPHMATVVDGDTFTIATGFVSDPAQPGNWTLDTDFASAGDDYIFTGTPTAVTAVLQNLVFVPERDRVAVGLQETTTFTLLIDDGQGGTRTDSSVSTIVTSVDGAPDVSGFPTSLPREIPSADATAPINPFAGMGFTDEGDITATFSVVDTDRGTFTDLAGFVETPAGSGDFSLTGNPNTLGTAFASVEFTPTANFVPGGATFTITLSDSVGNVTTLQLPVVLGIENKTWIVTSTQDSGEGSLRDAVAGAKPGDHIVFDIPLPSTITLTTPIQILQPLTINGAGAKALTLSGGGTSQILHVMAPTTLHHLKFADAKAGFGGAVSVENGGSLVVENCAFVNCVANQWGGAIDVYDGGLMVNACLFENNSTDPSLGRGGGAISLYSDAGGSISNSTFSGNLQAAQGGLGGGAIYAENVSPGSQMDLLIDQCTFHGNSDAANVATTLRVNVQNTIVSLSNSIVASASSTDNLSVLGAGEIVSRGGNLSDDSTVTILHQGGQPVALTLFDGPGDQIDTDPQLLPLADNGGPTMTHAIASGGPAHDLGRPGDSNSPTFSFLAADQRGYWRAGTNDVGAFELDVFNNLVINEINFQTGKQFVEIYNRRDSATIQLQDFTLWVDGDLKHTFGATSIVPGAGQVLYSDDYVPASSVPRSDFPLRLDADGSMVAIANPAGQIVYSATYLGIYAEADSGGTNSDLGPGQSLTLSPQQDTGTSYLPHRRAGASAGLPPGGLVDNSPDLDIFGVPLGGGNAPPIAVDDDFETDEDTPLTLSVTGNDIEFDRLDILRVEAVYENMPATFGATVPQVLTAESASGARLTVSPGGRETIAYEPAFGSGATDFQRLPVGAMLVDSFAYNILDYIESTNTAHSRSNPGNATLTDDMQNVEKATTSVSLRVLGVNDAPVLPSYSYSTDEGQPIRILLEEVLPAGFDFGDPTLVTRMADAILPTSQDYDIDSDDENSDLLITSVGAPGDPAAPQSAPVLNALSACGAPVVLDQRFRREETNIVYDPSGSSLLEALRDGQTFDDEFQISVVDRHGASALAIVTVTVTGKNDGPTANPDDLALATDEDTPLTITAAALLGNDTDPDTNVHVPGDNPDSPVIVAAATSALGATLSVVGGDVMYDPRSSDILDSLAREEQLVDPIEDTFVYTIEDEGGVQSSATVRIRVIGVNDPPRAIPDSFITDEDTVITFGAGTLLANDEEDDINSYAPDDTLRILPVEIATAQGGLVSVGGDGSFSFDPTRSQIFNGLRQDLPSNRSFLTDSFTYTVVDNSLTLAADDTFSVVADSPGVILPVQANDGALPFPALAVNITEIVSNPDKGGSATLTSDGSGINYTPLTNFVGVETLVYKIEDGLGGVDTAQVRIRVAVQNLNGNLAAGNDTFTVGADSTAILPVLVNDNTLPLAGSNLTIVGADPPLQIVDAGKALSYVAPAGFTGPVNLSYTVSAGGTARASANIAISVENYTLGVQDDIFRVEPDAVSVPLDVLANDTVLPGATGRREIVSLTTAPADSVSINAELDRIVYSAPSGFTGQQTITYEVSDGAGGSATATATVIVEAPALTAGDDRFTVYRGSTSNLLPVVINDVETPGGDGEVTISDVGIDLDAPDNGGTVSIDQLDGHLNYTPEPNFVGTEMFKYEISDGSLNRSEGTVTIQVIDREDLLSPQADHFTVAEDTSDAMLDVLANDLVFPLTGETWQVTSVGTPANGAAVLGGAGEFIEFTPDPGFVGQDSFTYSVSDSRGGTGTATVTVDVGDLPVDEDKFNVLSDSSANVLDVLVNDGVLPLGSAQLTVIGVDDPADGTAIVNPVDNRSILYTPDANFVGTDTFSYQVRDSLRTVSAQVSVKVYLTGSDRSSTVVSIEVDGVNDPPVIEQIDNTAVTDKGMLNPFANALVIEVDDNGAELLELTLSIDNLDKGVLSDLGGFVEVSPGVFSMTGTAAEIQTALRGIVFTPTENRITVDSAEDAIFQIEIRDPFVTVPTNGDAAVRVQSVNDPPVFGGTRAGQQVYHHLTIAAFSGITLTDVDDLTLQPITVTIGLDAAEKGVFTNLGGFVMTSPGHYSMTASPAALSQAMRALQFQPTTGGRIGPRESETTNFTVTVSDGFAPTISDQITSVIAHHGRQAISVAVTAAEPPDHLGSSVAVDGDLMVGGAPDDDVTAVESGSAYIFARNAGGPNEWEEIHKLAPASIGRSQDRFGWDVDVSGDTVVVSAPFRDTASGTDRGAITIFERNQGGADQWGISRTMALPTAIATEGTAFGYSLALQGDTLVVGAPLFDQNGTDAGSVFVFRRNEGGAENWGLTQTLFPSNPGTRDEFGNSVAIDGTSIIIGADRVNRAPGELDFGAAYIFELDGGTWTESERLDTFADGAAGDRFGKAVDISENIAVVGASRHDSGAGPDQRTDSGAAYVFYRDEGGVDNWGRVTMLTGSPISTGDAFGRSVAVVRDLIFVGSPLDNADADSNVIDVGSAYLFGRDLGGDDQWGLAEKFTSDPPTSTDVFGTAVALDESGTGAVGCPGDLAQMGRLYVYQFGYPNAPSANVTIPDQVIQIGESFNLMVPSEAFGDPDLRDSDSFTYSATSPGGAPLPAWLTLDPDTGTFAGAPLASDAGSSEILVTVTDRDGFSATAAAFTLTVAPPTAALALFDAWRQAQFSAAVLNDPGSETSDWGVSADGEGDEIQVLLEFFMGLDPHANDGIDALRFERNGPNSATLYYRRSKSVPPEMGVPEWSMDAENWSPGSISETVVSDLGDAEIVAATLTVVGPAPARIFMRLRVMIP